MEHFLSPPEIVRPWRTATLVATAIAGIELVLLVVAGIVLIGRSLGPHAEAATVRTAAAPTAKHAPTTTPAAALKPHPAPVAKMLSRERTRIVVLNGNGVAGAAAQAASLIRARGYTVQEVTNAPRTGFAQTLVMYRPKFRREAVRFRHDLNMGVVTPLDGMKPGQLHGAHLVLILGASR